MLFHPLALSSLLLVASLGLATGLLVAVPRQPVQVGEAHRVWSLGLFFAPLGWMLLELGALMPSNTLSVAAKTSLAAGFAAYLVATMRLAGVRASIAWIALPVVFVLSASLWVRWQTPNLPMGSGLVSLVCTVFAAGVAMMAIRAARDGVAQAWTLASAFCVSTLALGTRSFLVLLPESSALREGFDSAGIHGVLLGAAILAPALATLAFLLKGNADEAAPAQADGSVPH